VLRLRVQAAAHDGEQVQALALHFTLWGDAWPRPVAKHLKTAKTKATRPTTDNTQGKAPDQPKKACENYKTGSEVCALLLLCLFFFFFFHNNNNRITFVYTCHHHERASVEEREEEKNHQKGGLY